MRKLIALLAVLALAGCDTPAAVPQQLKVACAVDGAVVPLADPMIALLVPSAAPAVGVDQLLVHPAVVATCAALGGSPVAAATELLSAVAADPKVAAKLAQAAPAVAQAAVVSSDVATLTAAGKAAAEGVAVPTTK